MIRAIVEIDGGSTYGGQNTFDVKPELGDTLVYGSGSTAGRATVTGFEHREKTDGFAFVVLAERNPTAEEISGMVKVDTGLDLKFVPPSESAR